MRAEAVPPSTEMAPMNDTQADPSDVEDLDDQKRAELHELARLHRQHGNAFALEGIRVLVYLNGGALAAIPIASEVLSAFEIPFPALFLGSAFFALGLLLVGFVCLFAYFAEDTVALAYDNRAFGFDDEAQAEISKHSWFRWSAIGCALGSAGAFIVACMILFLSAQQKITVQLSWDDLSPKSNIDELTKPAEPE